MPAYTPPTPYTGLGPGAQAGPDGLQVIDELLTNVAKMFRPDGYLYDQIVAPMPVQFNIGRYPVFDPSGYFAAPGNIAVADDAPTPLVDFKWSTDYYNCLDYRLQTRITRKENLQANPVLRLDYAKTVGLLTQFATAREVRLANKLRAQSNGGQFVNAAVTPSVKWDAGNATAPATIQSDLQGAALQVMKQCGKRPNTLILDFQVAYAIANDYTLKDLIKYQMGSAIVRDALQAVLPPTLFGFKVVVADGTMQNTNGPGATANLTGVWGNSARLIYTDPNAQWGQPSTVYSFRGRVNDGPTQAPEVTMPNGDAGNEPGPSGGWAVVDRWYDIDPPAVHIRAWECVDERVVAPELGIEIQNVLASPVY